MADWKGENKIFKQQQQDSFGGIQDQAGLYNQAVGNFSNMMAQSYGRQSAVFDALQGSLASVMGRGAGSLTGDYWKDPGFLPGLENANSEAQASGGKGLSPQEMNQIRRAIAEKRASGDEQGAQQMEQQFMSGYNPSLFNAQFQPRRFQAKEQAALRSQMAEEATNSYGDAEAAFGLRAQQLGGLGGGAEAEALRKMESDKAGAQMEGQRQAILFGAQNLREDQRAFAPLQTQLQLANADALAREAQMQNQLMMQKAAMAAQEAASRRAAASARAGSRQQAQQFSAAQRQRAAEFAAEMKLKGAQFDSENYFRSIGAMSGLAGMMDPNVYGGLMNQALGGPMQGYGNAYNTASQGMVQTARNPLWGQLLGGALGAGLNFATGGMNSMFGGGRGGGGRQMGSWESAAYNNGNPYNYGPGY